MRARIVWLLLIAAIGLGGGPARADEREGDREEARREFAAGQAADRRRDWQTAIEHYLRAHDLVPHPFAVYNIAINYERLGKLREAAIWYERYLASSTDTIERERIGRTLLDLRARPAPLEVRSAPERARVYVDAIPVGMTPYRGTIKSGFHRVGVELDGRRAHRDVTVEYGEPVSLELVLRPATGLIRVKGEPYGAAIQVDGRAAGRLPVRIKLEAGPHRVRVTSPGHVPFETAVTVEPDREALVDAQLSPIAGAGDGTGTVAGTGTGTRVIRGGYLIGFAGGADALGSGGLGLLELGVRFGPLDGGARVGRAAGITIADLLARWTLTAGRIAPFAGASLSFVEDGGGYGLSGGLRWDVVRAERTGVSVLLESGLRYYRSTVSEPGEAPVTTRGFIVPLMASVLVLYK